MLTHLQQADGAIEAVTDNTAAMIRLSLMASASDVASEQLDENYEESAPINWGPAMSAEQVARFNRYYASGGFKTSAVGEYPEEVPRPARPRETTAPDAVRPGSGTNGRIPAVIPGSTPPSQKQDLCRGSLASSQAPRKLEAAKAELTRMEREEGFGRSKAAKRTGFGSSAILVATLSVPFRMFVPFVRGDNEEGVQSSMLDIQTFRCSIRTVTTPPKRPSADSVESSSG